MADNLVAAVVHCVNVTILEHDRRGVHDNWGMAKNYKYDSNTIRLFLNSVLNKLKNTGFKFSFNQNFGDGCLDKTLDETKTAIIQNTVAA